MKTKYKTGTELLKAVSKKTGVPLNQLSIALPVFWSEILNHIQEGTEVRIHGFGRFYVNDRPGHYQYVITGWDKKTNKPVRDRMYCRPKKRVRFRPMKYFKEAVAELNIKTFGDQAFNTKERFRK